MELKPGYKQTEVGVIPEEWEVKTLGDIFNISGGFTASRDQLSTEGYCYLHYGDIHKSSKTFVDVQAEYLDIPKLEVSLKRVSSRSLLKDGDIVFVDASEDDEGTSKHVVVKNEAGVPYISGLHTIVAKSRTAAIDNRYKQFCFNTADIKRQFYFYAAGTKVSGISKTNIAKLFIPLPSPPEQRAIAAPLSDVDGLIFSLEKLIAKKRDLKQAAMQQLLTGQTRLSGFSREWEVRRLGEVLRFQVGFPFSSIFFNDEGHGIRLVKNRDLKTDDQVTHYSGQYTNSFLVSEGDVLVGMDGDFLPCLWAKGPALLNQRVGRILPLEGLNREFAFYYLIGPLKEIEITTSSTTVKHLSHGEIEDIEKPIPELTEQIAIAAVLSDMDAELSVLEARRDKTRVLKQGMMQELLTGRTRLV